MTELTPELIDALIRKFGLGHEETKRAILSRIRELESKLAEADKQLKAMADSHTGWEIRAKDAEARLTALTVPQDEKEIEEALLELDLLKENWDRLPKPQHPPPFGSLGLLVAIAFRRAQLLTERERRRNEAEKKP